MLKLYTMRRSGNAYKARLMLGLLGLPYETLTVNLVKKEQMQPAYLAINPLHTVPVLDDDGLIIRDSAAILVYLASKYDPARTWYPADAKGMAEVQQWLAFASGDIGNTIVPARILGLGMREGNLAEAQAKASVSFAHIDASLKGRQWLAGSHPTVADVACYSYVALVEQTGFALTAFPEMAAWCRRIEALKGYVALPPKPAAPDWQ